MDLLVMLMSVTGAEVTWRTNRWPHVRALVMRSGGIRVEARRSLAEGWKAETEGDVSAYEAAEVVTRLLNEAGFDVESVQQRVNEVEG